MDLLTVRVGKKLDFVSGLESYCFMDRQNTEKVIIDSSIREIGEHYFFKCKNLKHIVFEGESSLQKIGDSAFSETAVEEVILPDGITHIGARAFANCKNLKRIVIPEGVTYIGSEAFEGCESLEEIVLPKSLENLNYRTFCNCKNLKSINLPKTMTKIPDGLFSGCKSLNIELSKNITSIGKEGFRDCKALTKFPICSIYDDGAFMGCTSLTSVDLSNVVSLGARAFLGCSALQEVKTSKPLYILPKCFKDCTSLKILPNVANFPEGAFENCTSLEEVRFNLKEKPDVHARCFKGCRNLKRVINFSVSNVFNEAFSDCVNLENVPLSDKTTAIGHGAFYNCRGMKELQIPYSVRKIHKQAFLNMLKLKKIKVDPKNRYYSSFQDRVLINEASRSIVYYAPANEEKDFSIMDYCYSIKNGYETISPIEQIEDFAFFNASHLNTITIPTSLTTFGKHSFHKNNKNLIVKDLELFKGFQLNVQELIGEKPRMLPFEHIEFEDSIHQISWSLVWQCPNLKTIHLPSELGILSNFHFSRSPYLDTLRIPSRCKNIRFLSLPENTTLDFEGTFKVKSKFFHGLSYNNEAKCFDLENGTFIQEKNGELIHIEKDYIEKNFSNPEFLKNNPSVALSYMKVLKYLGKDCRFLRNGIFPNAFTNEQIYIFQKELEKSIEEEKRYTLYSTKEMKEESVQENIVAEHSILRIKEILNRLEASEVASPMSLRNTNYGFSIQNFDENVAKQFLLHYDNNMKRAISLSKVLENPDTAIDNLFDLLKLVEVLGGYSDDPIVKQRALTFICDRILTKQENDSNVYYTVGDDIHRRYGELNVEEKGVNPEFIQFFMENYDKLCSIEAKKAGFITRIYNSFETIQKTTTSDHGCQRRLLVTIEKVLNYFDDYKFKNVDKQNLQFAKFIGKWYDKNDNFVDALLIMEEAKAAPRNIFATLGFDEENNMIFDDTNCRDLKEEAKDGQYQYEWLPKQDKENLILGKYCNCCAHLTGAGAGIMRASMISCDHQNMVIRKDGEIIAKATIYINREKGYGVFNTIETNMNYRTDEDRQKIYDAFMRGAEAFYTTYNENNPRLPLSMITIGGSRNSIKDILVSHSEAHPQTDILDVPPYGKWSYCAYGNYNGDSKNEQRLVLRR